MLVIIWVVCVICAFELYKTLRFCFKQARMKYKLSALCKRRGYVISKLAHGYYLVDARGRSISIRVLGARSKYSHLYFSGDGTYCFRYLWSIPLRFEQAANFSFCGRVRAVPKDAEVILLCPVCKNIAQRCSDGSTLCLGNGDIVDGARLYSLAGVLSYIERV